MLNTILSLDLAVSMLCGLFGLHMLRIAAQRRVPAIFLACIFILLAIHALLINVIVSFDRPPFAASLLPVVPVLIGPLMLLFFQAVRTPDQRIQPTAVLHAAPAILVFLQMTSGVLIAWVDAIVLGSLAFYTLRLGLIAVNGVSHFSRLGPQAFAVYSWLIASTGYLFLSLITDVAILIEVNSGAAVDQSYGLLVAITFKLITVSLLIWMALERTFYFDWIYAIGGRGKSNLSEREQLERDQALVKRFEELTRSPGFFDAPAPSLNSMARQLQASPRHLSEAINSTYGESYSKQMNRRRIERAKRLLSEHPDMPVTDVMFSSGFQTKSSFNKEFRAILQMSPTEYRQQILPPKD